MLEAFMGKVNPNQLARQMEETTQEFGNNQVCKVCEALIMNNQCLCENGPSFEEVPLPKPESRVAPAPVATSPLSPPSTTKEMLQRLPGAPSNSQIENWKATYGKAYVLPLDRDEVYVWRYLNYQEFKKLRSNKVIAESEEKFQEHIVMTAVLWPTIGPVELATSRAGLIPTLFGVIMKGSFFLDTEIALGLIDEL